MRLAADFLPHIRRGAGSGLLVRQRLMVEQPQAPQALQTRDVTRFREVLADLPTTSWSKRKRSGALLPGQVQWRDSA